MALVLPAVLFLSGLVVNHKSPFGPMSRSINDLGYQFEPMHALLRDVLTGSAPGGWQINWSSGLGVPFIPDYATYLASPFAVAVLATPRELVPVGLVAITAAKYSTAAGAMFAYLRTRRPDGPMFVASLLAVAYATCGWALDDASYGPMWLDGLIGLPLLGLAGLWAMTGRRMLLSPLVVAVVWWANFYTAWMATLGAGLLLLGSIATSGVTWRRALGIILRFSRDVLLGVLGTGLTLIPTLWAVSRGQPSGTSTPLEWSVADSLSRLLPVSEGVGATPGLFIGTMPLVFALTLPWLGQLSMRARWVPTALVIACGASLFWGPTMALWHGFDTPQGSPFRQAFIVCGLLVVNAWLAVDAIAKSRTFPFRLLVGVAMVGGLLYVVQDSPWVSAKTAIFTLASLSAVSAGVLIHRSGRGSFHRVATTVAAVVMVMLWGGEAFATAWHVAQVRDERFAPIPRPWDSSDEALVARAVTMRERPHPGRTLVVPVENPNASMLYGTAASDYYSSLMPAVTADLLAGLGHPVEGYGRRVFASTDPAVLAVEGVSQVLAREGTASGGDAPAGAKTPAVPFVRLLDEGAPPVLRAAADPSAVHEALLGPGTIIRPDVTMDLGAGAQAYPRSGVIRTGGDLPDIVLSAQCPAGSAMRLWAPDQGGSLTDSRGEQALLPKSQTGSDHPYARNGLIALGTSPVEGVPPADSAVTVRVVIHPVGGIHLPSQPITCVDLARLGRAVTSEAVVGAPTAAWLGDGFRAQWDQAVSGVALAATSATQGWTCRAADGGEVPQVDAGGWLALRLIDTNAVSCQFATPGLTVGAVVSAVALILIPLTAGVPARPRRRFCPRAEDW